MGKWCSVKGCRSDQSEEDITFHNFRRENAPKVIVKITNESGAEELVDVIEAWERATGVKYFHSRTICSLHFTRTDFILPDVPTKRKRLKCDAVPSQNLPSKSQETQKPASNVGQAAAKKPRTKAVGTKAVGKKSGKPKDSNNSKENEGNDSQDAVKVIDKVEETERAKMFVNKESITKRMFVELENELTDSLRLLEAKKMRLEQLQLELQRFKVARTIELQKTKDSFLKLGSENSEMHKRLQEKVLEYELLRQANGEYGSSPLTSILGLPFVFGNIEEQEKKDFQVVEVVDTGPVSKNMNNFGSTEEDSLRKIVKAVDWFCDLCCVAFTTRLGYICHCFRIHKDYKCQRCGGHFENRRLYDSHYPQCRKKKPAPVVVEVTEIVQPEVKPEPPPKLLRCRDCALTFKAQLSLDIHSRDHADLHPFVCDYCAASFSRKYTMRRHVQDIHERPNQRNIIRPQLSLDIHSRDHADLHPFVCDYCAASFSRKFTLKRHVRDIHERPNQVQEDGICKNPLEALSSFPCKECPRVYSSQAMLNSHTNKHKLRPYPCDRCGAAFSKMAELKRHDLKVHNKKKEKEPPRKQRTCNKCWLRFNNEKLFAAHPCTGKKNPEVLEKKFHCQVCSKGFIRKRSLQDHIYCHMVGKEMTCKYCGKNFDIRVSYAHHVRRHELAEGFQEACSVCGEVFTDSINLEKHLSIHGREWRVNHDILKKLGRDSLQPNPAENVAAGWFVKKVDVAYAGDPKVRVEPVSVQES